MLSYLSVFKEICYCRNYFRNRNLRFKFRLNQLNLVKFISPQKSKDEQRNTQNIKAMW